MAVKQNRILKSDSIKIEGVQKISHQSQNSSRSGSSLNNGQFNAEIIQKEPDFAIIEITCSCGEKAQIRCDYAAE
jgi:hypothetical protein